MNNINIEDYLSTSEFKSKHELAKETGLTERAVRRKISALKLERPVIYNSQTKGYRLAKNFSGLSSEEFKEELELIRHSKNDIMARTKVMNKQLRTYIAYEKAAEVYCKIVS